MATVFDTQKIRVANEIARPYNKQNPAVGVQHWETMKVKVVKGNKPMKKYIIPICIVLIVIAPFVLLGLAAVLP